jgi:hypothetical protein
VASKFGYGPKHVPVRAEHGNELTVMLNANGPFESTKQKTEIERESGREGGIGLGCSWVSLGLATAMQVARAGTYETRDIIGKHRSRATAPFRA